MTISINNNKVIYNCNDITRNWVFDFPVLESSHIKVYITYNEETILKENNYYVDLLNSYVVCPTVESGEPLLTSEYKITIVRDVPLLQESSYANQGKFPSVAIEKSLDKLTMQIQQQAEITGRCVKFDISTIDPEQAIDIYKQELLDIRDEAEVFKDEAETAKDEAETAQGLAETAQGLAEGYRDEAEGFKDDAKNYLDNATGISPWIAPKEYTKNMMCIHNEIIYYAKDVVENIGQEPPNSTYWLVGFADMNHDHDGINSQSLAIDSVGTEQIKDDIDLKVKGLVVGCKDDNEIIDSVSSGYNNIYQIKVGNFIVVSSDSNGLLSYSIDEDGNFTLIDSYNDLSGSYQNMFYDDNFIYVNVVFGVSSVLTFTLDVDGNFVYKNTTLISSTNKNYNIWKGGDFILMSTTDGILSFSVDEFGALTQLDSDYQGGTYGVGVNLPTTNYNRNFILCNEGIRVYDVDLSGNLTFIDLKGDITGRHIKVQLYGSPLINTFLLYITQDGSILNTEILTNYIYDKSANTFEKISSSVEIMIYNLFEIYSNDDKNFYVSTNNGFLHFTVDENYNIQYVDFYGKGVLSTISNVIVLDDYLITCRILGVSFLHSFKENDELDGTFRYNARMKKFQIKQDGVFRNL